MSFMLRFWEVLEVAVGDPLGAHIDLHFLGELVNRQSHGYSSSGCKLA